MKRIVALLCITLFIGTSCTKFVDGPIFTFRSKTKRISHSWVYEAIIYNQTGITVSDHLPTTVMTFSKDGSFTENTGYTGTWKFSGQINLEIDMHKPNSPDSTIVWEITRLSNKQLWLELDKVDYHFKVK
jgi:hypothetical protein